MNNTKVLVGHVSVDSGQIILVDPCYVDDGLDYYEVCEVTLSDNHAGSWMNGHAVATSTGYGDGSYPVYVEYEDCGSWGKRVKSVTIEFLEDEVEDSWDEDPYVDEYDNDEGEF